MRSGHLLAQPHGQADLESADIAVDAVEDVQPDTTQMVPVTGGVRLTIFDLDSDDKRNPRVAPGIVASATTNDSSDTESMESDAALPALHCGDRIVAAMQLRPPPRYFDPGVWDYAGYLLTQGVGAHASLAAGKVQVLPPEHAPLQLPHPGRAAVGRE